MMIACGEYVIPGNKMPPNNVEAEFAYHLITDMIQNGMLTVRSEEIGSGQVRVWWEIRHKPGQ